MEIENVFIKSEHLDEEDFCIIEEELHIKAEENTESIYDKSYKCGICGHKTTSDVLLKVHMKMHLLKRIHQCKTCKKSFSFVTELNSHVLTHMEEAIQKHDRIHTKENAIVSASVPEIAPKRKFKNDPSLPLSSEEKLLLLRYVEELGLNKSYSQLEQLKGHIRNSWIRLAQLFAENDYDRQIEKLSRTYYHMKNQAKAHLEKFYTQNKVPEPHKIDYMFVKLCPADFNVPGVDIQRILEDANKFSKEIEDGNTLPVEKGTNSDVDSTSRHLLNRTPEEGHSNTLGAKKRLPNNDGPACKISKHESEINESHQIKRFLAEEQRKEGLYKAELLRKEELFAMEKQHRKEMYEKELEIKKLELEILRQRLESRNKFS